MLSPPTSLLNTGSLAPALLSYSIDQQTNKPPTIGKFITARQLLEESGDKMTTLRGPSLPKYKLVALAGSSDTGKSVFLCQLALGVALGDVYGSISELAPSAGRVHEHGR